MISEAAARERLARFVGRWVGEGETNGQAIRDEAAWAWALGGRFLKMSYRALDGDSFAAEGYFWYNTASGQFEFYEFNNGRAPVRFLVGHVEDETLVFEERTETNQVQIVFAWLDDDSLTMTETGRLDGRAHAVQETFRRPASSHG